MARRISELLDEGTPASEIAVLYRVNAQSETFEQALAELDIPYLVRGGERFFARAEVRQATVALRTAAAAGPTGELPEIGARAARAARADRRPAGRRRGAGAVGVAAGAGGAGRGAGARPSRAPTSRSTSPSWTCGRAAQHPPTVEGVTLASLHAAKGLEWDAVFLVGLVEGTMPILHADGDDAAIEEERRLLYVGVTRARRHLSLSWALARTESGAPQPAAQPVPLRADSRGPPDLAHGALAPA